MAIQYEIGIQMSAATVEALQQGGFALYAFKAIQTSTGGAAPTVWFSTQQFLETTQLVWHEQYQAYISQSQIIPNGVIVVNSAADIALGMTANVDQNGNLTVAGNGTPTAIAILNNANTPWTTGISQVVGGVPNPMCALPLYGNMLDVIAPIEKVLLMFATMTVNTGTVIYQAFSSGVLVDLTAAPQRMVSFDINSGWNWGGASWGTPVQPSENLVPILINN